MAANFPGSGMVLSKVVSVKPIVFLIHGLGPQVMTTSSLMPLEWYLNKNGYTRTHRVEYPVNELDLNEMLDYVDDEMVKHADRDTDEVILIGQSMGGVVANNLHQKGWDVKYAIYIGSPLHGAKLLNTLDSILPTTIRDYFFKKPYGYLMSKERDEIPPHDYHAITMSWPGTSFDGCVYQDEAMLEKDKHTHLRWADHRTIFFNPRLWITVENLLREKITSC